MESLLWLPLRMELFSGRRGGRTVAPVYYYEMLVQRVQRIVCGGGPDCVCRVW